MTLMTHVINAGIFDSAQGLKRNGLFGDLLKLVLAYGRKLAVIHKSFELEKNFIIGKVLPI